MRNATNKIKITFDIAFKISSNENSYKSSVHQVLGHHFRKTTTENRNILWTGNVKDRGVTFLLTPQFSFTWVKVTEFNIVCGSVSCALSSAKINYSVNIL